MSANTNGAVSLPRVLRFEAMNPAQKNALAQWGLGIEHFPGCDKAPVTWDRLSKSEQASIREAWERDQVGERKWQAETDAGTRLWEKDVLSEYVKRAEVNAGGLELGKSILLYIADQVQPLRERLDELQSVVNSLVEKRYATGNNNVDDEKLASIQRQLSRHAEHLGRLEDRTKRLETK